ncbi:MAG: hypothetical protein AB7J40_03985 [Candidatus Altimarinota bacterium]
MKIPEDTPTPSLGLRRIGKAAKLTPEEIQAKRKEIQMALEAKQPEKERQEALEKAAYQEYLPYVIHRHLEVFVDLQKNGIRIDEDGIDIEATQSHLKNMGENPLPIYPKPSEDIHEALKSGKIPLLKGRFERLGIARAAIICSDGEYFEININPGKQSIIFLKYTNDYFSAS